MTECFFCIPQIQNILRASFGRMSLEEMIAIRDVIETFGKNLGCVDNKTTCMPLERITGSINRKNDTKRA